MEKGINRIRAIKVVEPIVKRLQRYGNVEVCGSLRRLKPNVGDVDLLGDNPKMLPLFLTFGKCNSGAEKKGQIIMKGVQIDLKIVDSGSWGTGLMMWTGSKQENIRLRSIAKNKGLKLNEYGLWKGFKNLAKCKTEEQVYALLGEDYKLPEDRE